MSSRATSFRLYSFIQNTVRTFFAAGLQSLTVVLAVLLASPPQQALAQQPSIETTTFVPLPGSTFNILNPPFEPITLNPQIFTYTPPTTPITITPVAGTSLATSGITLISSTLTVTQNTQNCLTAPTSPGCISLVNTTKSSVSSLTNPANAPSGCQFADNPAQIVQCMNYNGGKFQAVFPTSWEASSLAAYMIAHGHPASDAQYIFQYGRADLRNEVRSWMAAQILGIIRKVANNAALTSDEQSVYTWMQTMIYALHAQAAQIAANEFQKWQSNPCNYAPNQTIQNALGIDLTTGAYCGASNFQNLFTQASFPPAAYFQTFGHAQVFEGQLGVTGTTSLINTELAATRVPPLVGQNAPPSQLQYLALLAAPAAAPAGTLVSVDAAYNAIFPYRAYTPYKLTDLPAKGSQAKAPYNFETDEPTTVGDSSVLSTADNPGVQAAAEGGQAAGNALQETQAGLQAVTDVDEGLDFVSAASAGATVVAVILFALTAAISEGISVSQSVQNQADDIQLAVTASLLKNGGLPDLTQLIQTSAGQLDIFEAFTLATLPDYPSSTPLPGYGVSALFTGAPIEGFYSQQAAAIDSSGPTLISNQLLNYVDPITQTAHTAALWNGFFILDGRSFGLTLPFTDQNLIPRIATRIGTNLFEVEPATYNPNAPYCQGDPTTGVTTALPAGVSNIIQCGSAVFEALRMWVGTASSVRPANIYITGAPVLTDKPQIGAIINQTKPISFSPASISTTNDPLGQIPCDAPAIVAGSPVSGEGGGTIDLPTFLPAGITIANQQVYSGNSHYRVGNALVGTPTNPNDAGKVFPIRIVSECGNNGWAGQQYNSVPFPTYGVPALETVNLVVGTNVAIDNYPSANLTLGVPMSETLVTVSNPVAKLTATGLPPGLKFKDNGDGTGTLSGVPTAPGRYNPTFSGNDVVDSASVTSYFTVIDSTPKFVNPRTNQKITVVSGISNDPRNIIPIQTNALAPMKLALSANSAANLSFSDFGNGTGQIVFNDPSPDFSETTLTLTATETNDTQVSSSVSFTIHANPAPPYITGSTNGPLAFIAGMPANTSNPPTVNTNNTSNTITPGYPSHHTPPTPASADVKTTMPAGLSFTNNANGAISITGTPAAGTGGYYQIPITMSYGGAQSIGQVNLVVYEAPSFPIYTGNHAFVFRVGTPRTVGISPVSGYPVQAFTPSDLTMGNSIGVVYALNASASVDSFGNISGTPFNIGNSLTGAGNGTFTLSYNGQAFPSGPSYTLPLVTQVETGQVPIGATSQQYIDQAPLSAQLYVLPPGDASGDGVVNCIDYTLVKSLQGNTVNNANFSALADLNGDGVINLQDLVLVTQNLPKGTVCH